MEGESGSFFKDIAFNKPHLTGRELEYMNEALHSGLHSGNYFFSRRVKALMYEKYGLEGVTLTPSGTAALEMGALLSDIRPGDEVILPSFTFTSTANAVLIFGAKPVFCEVSPVDMNIDVTKIEPLITEKTKMIIPIDYAGVPCDIGAIMEIANRHNLIVMQDCAQSYGSLYKGEMSGKQAHLACYSFHDTKNYSCGEGGALVVNVPEWREKASFIMEKGTDRTKVITGMQDKYSWIEKGSSYLLSDILAAMLLAQLEDEELIKEKRRKIDTAYRNLLSPFEKKGDLRISRSSRDVQTNYHGFYTIFNSEEIRNIFIEEMGKRNVPAYIGYVPLHSSKMGKKLGYAPEDLNITEELASRLVRLPLYTDLSEKDLTYICSAIDEVLQKIL